MVLLNGYLHNSLEIQVILCERLSLLSPQTSLSCMPELMHGTMYRLSGNAGNGGNPDTSTRHVNQIPDSRPHTDTQYRTVTFSVTI